MNKERRKQIKNQICKLEDIISNLESILSDEEYYYDNMPENLQGSLRGGQSEESIDILSEAIDSAQELIDNLNEIM